ncbi:MAG: L-2-amino-thiazoline-4-carboxylic acid hydrolase [Anaerolineales bacterium]
MEDIPCPKRLFPIRINFVSFYAAYLRWLRHLIERLGRQNTLSIWRNTFADYDDHLLKNILSSGWQKLESDETNQLEKKAEKLIEEFFPSSDDALSRNEVSNIIENTPPITEIKKLFSTHTIEKEITAYHALHLRFDGIACLAESLIDRYGKQGEFIVYDLMLEGRLASSQGETGRVEDFIEYFTSESDTPNLFTAGLEVEVINKSKREAVMYVRECEWARYFQERHPRVGYLMACSSDEAAYKAFNPRLRLQRTETIMEGGEKCDFRIYAVDEEPQEK